MANALERGQSTLDTLSLVHAQSRHKFGDPILFDETDTPDIPADILPDVYGEMAMAMSASAETPAALSVMAILGVLASAAMRNYKVCAFEDYSEPLNLYSAAFLPPGNLKSFVLNTAAAPLVNWERETSERLAPEIARQKSERKTAEKIIEARRVEVAKMGDQNEQRSATRNLAMQESEISEISEIPQLFANNTTPESLAEALVEQGGYFSILSDEGGCFEVLSGLYTNGRSNIDILLKGIDGGYVRIRRKGVNINLTPLLNIFVTAQPAVLLSIANNTAFAGRGLMERFLFVLPKSLVGWRKLNGQPIPAQIKQQYAQAVYRLLDFKEQRQTSLTLCPLALSNWHDFRASIEPKLRPNGELYICQGFGSKLPGFALRIAGLMHIAEHGDIKNSISAASMDRALTLASLLIKHAIAAWGLVGADQATMDAKAVWSWIECSNGTFTNGDLSRAMRHRMDAQRIAAALKILRCRELIDAGATVPRSRTVIYRTNPRLKVKEPPR